MRRTTIAALLAPALLLLMGRVQALADEVPWRRHTIDDTSRGADGVRLADINGDGLQDITTGWEEGGVIRVYLHPGHQQAHKKWPAVTVGKVRSPEDAVFVDLDADGATDVVSSCEGQTQTMFVHWAPQSENQLLEESAWTTQPIPATKKQSHWMFCVPAQVDGRHGIDLIVGSKGKQAMIGWLQAPQDPRQLDQWRLHNICDVGWIMSLKMADIDGDGDNDILASDRRGPQQGCIWLENPEVNGPLQEPWTKHSVGSQNREVMFLDYADVDGDGLRDAVVPDTSGDILLHRRLPGRKPGWKASNIPFPLNTGSSKSTAIGDINRDGRADIVFSCENSKGVSGIVWLEQTGRAGERRWHQHEISGPSGIKFDLIQLYDIDSDGDEDVLTCEERENLGVVWYENPTK